MTVKRTPEQTRDLLLMNMMAVTPPQAWPLHALVLGIQMTQNEPRLAAVILAASLEVANPDMEQATLVGIEQAIATLRDQTEL